MPRKRDWQIRDHKTDTIYFLSRWYDYDVIEDKGNGSDRLSLEGFMRYDSKVDEI